MRNYTGSENWFYVDNHNIAVIQSGWFPRHARGTNPDLPIWGTGQYDWRGFDPATNAYQRLPASANPRAINPAVRYMDTQRRGWVHLTVASDECVAEWRLIDTVHSRDYTATVDRRFAVRADEVAAGLRDAGGG